MMKEQKPGYTFERMFFSDFFNSTDFKEYQIYNNWTIIQSNRLDLKIIYERVRSGLYKRHIQIS